MGSIIFHALLLFLVTPVALAGFPSSSLPTTTKRETITTPQMSSTRPTQTTRKPLTKTTPQLNLSSTTTNRNTSSQPTTTIKTTTHKQTSPKITTVATETPPTKSPLTTTTKTTTTTTEFYPCEDPPKVGCSTAIPISDSEVKYECKPNYELIGNSIVYCGQSNVWTVADKTKEWPRCQLYCGSDPVEPSATVTKRGYNTETRSPTLTYQCVSGYESAYGLNSETIECNPHTVQWNLPNLHCIAKQNTALTFVNLYEDKDPQTCLPLTYSQASPTTSITLSLERPTQVYSLDVIASSNAGLYHTINNLKTFKNYVTSSCTTYTGHENTTYHNPPKPCQKWNTKHVNGVNFSNPIYFPYDGGDVPLNYCRLPVVNDSESNFSKRFRPWCFAGEKDTDWFYCSIQDCVKLRLDISVTNNNSENYELARVRMLEIAWTDRKLFQVNRKDLPVVGTAVKLDIRLAQDRTLDICEMAVIGRPHEDQCPKPPPAGTGQRLVSGGNHSCDIHIGPCGVGTKVDYVCEDGWHRVGGNTTIVCQSYRTWTALTLECIDKPEMLREYKSPFANQIQGTNNLATGSVFEWKYSLPEASEVHFAVIEFEIPAYHGWLPNITFMYKTNTSFLSCGTETISSDDRIIRFDCPSMPVTTTVKLISNVPPSWSLGTCTFKVFGQTFSDYLECQQGTPQSYRGHLNYNYRGEPCDYWHKYYDPSDITAFQGETVRNAANYCRSPSNTTSIRPWCYSGGKPTVCGIFKCEEICIVPWDPTGTEYKGLQDFERDINSSNSCSAWSTPLEEEHCQFLQDFMFPENNSDHNYCRNPDRRVSGPWCYVDVCSQNYCSLQQRSCHVPTCPIISSLNHATINLAAAQEIDWFYDASITECYRHRYQNSTDIVKIKVSPDWLERYKGVCQYETDFRYLLCHDNYNKWYQLWVVCEYSTLESQWYFLNPTSVMESTTAILTSYETANEVVTTLPISSEELMTHSRSSEFWETTQTMNTMYPSESVHYTSQTHHGHSTSSAVLRTTTSKTTDSSPRKHKQCPCGCSANMNDIYDSGAIEAKVNAIYKLLFIDKKTLSKTKRTKTSATDERASAITVGSITGLGFFCAIAIIVLLPDAINVYIAFSRTRSKKDEKETKLTECESADKKDDMNDLDS